MIDEKRKEEKQTVKKSERIKKKHGKTRTLFEQATVIKIVPFREGLFACRHVLDVALLILRRDI